LVRIAVSKSA